MTDTTRPSPRSAPARDPGDPRAPEQASPATARALVQMITGYWSSRAVYTAVRLGLADAIHALGRGAAVPVADLARELALHPSAVHRLLRALAGAGLFRQEGGRGDWRYAVTPLGEHLLADSVWSLRHAALMYGEEMALAWQDMPAVMVDEQPSWDRVIGSSHFGYYQQNPGAASVFDHAMRELGGALYRDSAIVDSYDFTGTLGPDAVVVDVGGGLGQLLAVVLQRGPAMRGVLFDRPHVIANAQALHRAGSGPAAGGDGAAEYRTRLDFEPGDFFDSVPAGGDVYVLKRVLHDWDDRRCAQILGTTSRTMREGARLLVVEVVLGEDDDSFGTWLDLNMMVVTGGRERTLEDFAALLEEAGLDVVGVHRTPSLLGIVEAVKN
jgi:DNA-binding MarR family transcriptional regulator